MLTQKTQPKKGSPCHFDFGCIFISQSRLIDSMFVSNLPNYAPFFLSVSCVDKLKEKIERKRMHHVSFIILNFIKIYLPHKNMKPWIMSSGNHESTSNQLKITAHLNTLSLCTLHHIVSFIEYEWHGNSSSFTTITMATNSMPAFHQTHQNEAHLRSYSRWSWILAFLRTRSHFYFPNFVFSLTCLILLWHGEFRSFCI